MAFSRDLASGELGACCRLPDGATLEEGERHLLLRAEALGVGIHAMRSPWRLDLQEHHHGALAVDVRRHAHAIFEMEYAADPGDWLPGPRTRDESWSPVVELERLVVGAPALWILFRRRYQPGSEVIEGQLLLPVAEGLITISLLASDQLTGYRESALSVLRPELLENHPGQPYFDDPAHDGKFPKHSLARVRAARVWLLDPERGGATITRPAPPEPAGEVLLEEASSAVVPPPRFLRLPAGALQMSPSLAVFSRVALGRAVPRMMNVWRFDGIRLGRFRRAAQLRGIARDSAEDWKKEGATNVEVDLEMRLGPRGHEARSHIRFQSNRTPQHEAQVWFADGDGTVFRIGSSAPPQVPAAELWSELEAVSASWRRL
jgi:hypothetical protein